MNYSVVYLAIMIIIIGITGLNLLFLTIDFISWIIRVTGAIKTSKADLGYKFVWCGNALGISSNREFFAYKFLFASIIFTLSFFILNTLSQINLISVIAVVILTVFGFRIPDIILYIAKKQREKAILSEAPVVINKLSQAPDGGDFEEIIKAAAQETRGPLSKELNRLLAIQLYSPDFEENIKDFKKRLNISAAENLEMAIRNKYYTGVYNNVYTGSALLLQNKINAGNKLSGAFVYSMLGIHIATVVAGFILFVMPVI